jgi:hypothetical protein
MDGDILIRLRVDPGRRTLGELLQENECGSCPARGSRSPQRVPRSMSRAWAGDAAARIEIERDTGMKLP